MRLSRHHLLEPARRERVLEVVADVCGIHAQVMSSAELSLGLRVAGFNKPDLHHALWQERALVKTYGLRGTVHIFTRDDFPLWLAALQAAPPPCRPTQQELNVLNAEQHALVVDAMRDALDSQRLTRDELAGALEQRLGSWVIEKIWPAFAGMLPRWQLALGTAARDGVLVFGPPRGNRVTYVRTEQWLGPLPKVDGDAALRTVLLRYLHAYGPATDAEFARWFNVPVPFTRELFASVSDRLVEVDVEGWRAWLPKDSLDVLTTIRPSSVHLLAQYDCYIVGCFPREQLIPSEAPSDLQKGTAAPYSVLLLDGVVGGLWSRTRRGKTLELQVDAFEKLSAAQTEAVETQAHRIGEIIGAEPKLTFGYVKPRWHM